MTPADKLNEARQAGRVGAGSHRGAAREDSFDNEKRGRVVNELQGEAAARARVATLLSVPPTGPVRFGKGGAKSATGGGLAKAPSRESVLKVIGWTKSARSPVRQARYVGRARDTDQAAGLDPLPMENERGELIAGKTAIDAEINSWSLAADRDNLSAAARAATPAERQAMAPKTRLAPQPGRAPDFFRAGAQHVRSREAPRGRARGPGRNVRRRGLSLRVRHPH